MRNEDQRRNTGKWRARRYNKTNPCKSNRDEGGSGKKSKNKRYLRGV